MCEKNDNVGWPRVVRLEVINRRYQAAVRSAPMPHLSVEEIDILFWGLATDGQPGYGESKATLVQWCQFRKDSDEYDWHSDLWYSANYPEGTSKPSPLDHSVSNRLIERIGEWTEIERIKVMQMMEDFWNIRFKVIELTPKMIFGILKQQKLSAGR